MAKTKKATKSPRKAVAKSGDRGGVRKATTKHSSSKKASSRKASKKKVATKRAASSRRRRSRPNLTQILEAKLSEQRDEILSLYWRDLGVGVEVSHEGDDEVDRANFDSNRDLALALFSGERETLLQIEDALTRIEQKVYGDCVSCSKPVGEERLRIIPWARHCVSCQELEEKGLLE